MSSDDQCWWWWYMRKTLVLSVLWLLLALLAVGQDGLQEAHVCRVRGMLPLSCNAAVLWSQFCKASSTVSGTAAAVFILIA
jgi:hypothetical protein